MDHSSPAEAGSPPGGDEIQWIEQDFKPPLGGLGVKQRLGVKQALGGIQAEGKPKLSIFA